MDDGDFGEFGDGGMFAAAKVGFSLSGSSVVETIAVGDHGASLTFTLESGSSTVYRLTAPAHGEMDATAPTYGFTGIGGATLVETITDAHGSTMLTYDAVSGSAGQYQLATELVTFAAAGSGPAATYAIAGATSVGAGGSLSVTGITETVTNGGSSHSVALAIPPDAVFSSGSGTVSESFAVGSTVETVTYSGTSGGSYSLTSIQTSFVNQGGAATALDVEAFERAEFTIASGAVTAMSTVSPSGTATAVTANSHVSFSIPASGFVEESVTRNGHSSFELFYDASGKGIYTAIAHGSGTTVDLAGIQAQLSQLPSAVAALL